MKRDEPFNPSVKSSAAPAGLLYRLAEARDVLAVARLMGERNPQTDPATVLAKTENEIRLNVSTPDYRLFVADLDGRVVGFSRHYHSDGLPPERKIYPAPEGWYAMGLLVDSSLRRQGIAGFLFENRLNALRAQGADRLYSIVDLKNQTSMRMHEKFGFTELIRAPGFLHMMLESGEGALFTRDL